MKDAVATTNRPDVSLRVGDVEDALQMVWTVGTTASFTQGVMEDALDKVFSSTLRAVERHDRTILGWLSDSLGSIAIKLLRDDRPSPTVYFAVYVQALADVTHAISSNDIALKSVHASVNRSKHVLPLLTVLNQSSTPMTARQLANRLALKPNNLSPVLKAAADAGVMSCAVTGRHKLCGITVLGRSYLDEITQPVARLVSQRLVEQYWTAALHTPNDDDAVNQVKRANPAVPENELEKLLVAARRVDGSQVAVRETRERFGIGTEWHVLLGTRRTSRMLLGRDLANSEIPCTVLDNMEQYVRFRCDLAEYGIDEFELPYKLLFEDKVRVRRFRAQKEIAKLRPAGFTAIMKSVQRQNETECVV